LEVQPAFPVYVSALLQIQPLPKMDLLPADSGFVRGSARFCPGWQVGAWSIRGRAEKQLCPSGDIAETRSVGSQASIWPSRFSMEVGDCSCRPANVTSYSPLAWMTWCHLKRPLVTNKLRPKIPQAHTSTHEHVRS
jgi:hypothetical protein